MNQFQTTQSLYFFFLNYFDFFFPKKFPSFIEWHKENLEPWQYNFSLVNP